MNAQQISKELRDFANDFDHDGMRGNARKLKQIADAIDALGNQHANMDAMLRSFKMLVKPLAERWRDTPAWHAVNNRGVAFREGEIHVKTGLLQDFHALTYGEADETETQQPKPVSQSLQEAAQRVNQELLEACIDLRERLLTFPCEDFDVPDELWERFKHSITATEAVQVKPEIPRVLFDGLAVFEEIGNDPRAAARTSAENVSDVLDAVVTLIRKGAQ